MTVNTIANVIDTAIPRLKDWPQIIQEDRMGKREYGKTEKRGNVGMWADDQSDDSRLKLYKLVDNQL